MMTCPLGACGALSWKVQSGCHCARSRQALYPPHSTGVTPLVKSARWPLVTMKNLREGGKKEPLDGAQVRVARGRVALSS